MVRTTFFKVVRKKRLYFFLRIKLFTYFCFEMKDIYCVSKTVFLKTF